MPLPLVVESGKTIPVGRKIYLRPRLLRDRLPIDLTGKTVTVTIRAEADPQTSLGAAWDDESVTLANEDYTAAQGGVAFQRELVAPTFVAPAPVEGGTPYLAEFYIVEDDYSPRKVRFHVTQSLRA